MAQMTLRTATPDDARAIAEIHVAAWRAAYRGLMPEDFLARLSVDERIEMWSSILSRPRPARVTVAEIDSVLAGFCSYGPTRDDEPPDVAEIYAVNIRPGNWRQGAGRALCERAYREAAARGHTAMTLWVLKGNETAFRFYESLGYERDGAVKTDTSLIGSPIIDLRYRKAIA
jgi:ribosomal protein S18 acetylase RimI-like enzyme